MTDKVQEIREEVVGIINSINLFTPDEDGKNSSYEAGKLDAASKILQVIDSSQEEPISEDLEIVAHQCYEANDTFMDGFKKGFKYGEEKLNRQYEKAIKYVKEHHSPDEVSEFQRAMNIAVAIAFNRGMELGSSNNNETGR